MNAFALLRIKKILLTPELMFVALFYLKKYNFRVSVFSAVIFKAYGDFKR